MKKRRVYLFSIAILIVGFIAFAVSKQNNNIKALMSRFLYSDDEIEMKISQSKDNLQETLQQFVPEAIRDFTVEEEEKIRTGELLPEEAITIIIDESALGHEDLTSIEPRLDVSDENTGSLEVIEKPSVTSLNDEERSKSQDVNLIISRYVAKLYLYKAQYIAKLGELEKNAKAEYLALPAEKQNNTGKSKILLSKITEAAALEKKCDDQVNMLLEGMKTDLSEKGGDLAIIAEIKKAYSEEKSLKKAHYLGLVS